MKETTSSCQGTFAIVKVDAIDSPQYVTPTMGQAWKVMYSYDTRMHLLNNIRKCNRMECEKFRIESETLIESEDGPGKSKGGNDGVGIDDRKVIEANDRGNKGRRN